MRIVLDFDHTLYSTKSLYEALKAAFAGLGVDEDLFQQTFQESKGSGRDYKPARQIKMITARAGIKADKLEKEFKRVLKIAPDFLYPDTEDFLRSRKKTDKLFILSYGEEKFQNMKVESAKISKYFRKVSITRDIGKSKPFKVFLSKKEKTLFLEDNPQALMEVKKVYPQVIAVRMRRGEGKYADAPDNEYVDFQVKNLKELEEIINSLN